MEDTESLQVTEGQIKVVINSVKRLENDSPVITDLLDVLYDCSRFALNSRAGNSNGQIRLNEAIAELLLFAGKLKANRDPDRELIAILRRFGLYPKAKAKAYAA